MEPGPLTTSWCPLEGCKYPADVLKAVAPGTEVFPTVPFLTSASQGSNSTHLAFAGRYRQVLGQWHARESQTELHELLRYHLAQGWQDYGMLDTTPTSYTHGRCGQSITTLPAEPGHALPMFHMYFCPAILNHLIWTQEKKTFGKASLKGK